MISNTNFTAIFWSSRLGSVLLLLEVRKGDSSLIFILLDLTLSLDGIFPLLKGVKGLILNKYWSWNCIQVSQMLKEKFHQVNPKSFKRALSAIHKNKGNHFLRAYYVLDTLHTLIHVKLLWGRCFYYSMVLTFWGPSFLISKTRIIILHMSYFFLQVNFDQVGTCGIF